MEEEKGKQEMTETDAQGNLNAVKGRRGPTWPGWVLSILVAVILSVTATLLLGGYGAGSNCCPPSETGK
jgi:hypothetical protein